MALRACCGAGLLAGFLQFLVAFGAQLVHHIFLLQFPIRLEFCDTACFLRKYGMANVAITEFLLVLMMGKSDVASLTAIQIHVRGPLVLAGRGGCNG